MAAAAIAGTKVGTGYVSMEPDFSGFQEKVAKKLNQALAPAFRKASKDASRGLAQGLDREVDKAIAPVLMRRMQSIGRDAGDALAKGMRSRSSRSSSRKTASAVSDSLGLGEMSDFFKQVRRDAERNFSPVERVTARLRSRMRNLGGDFSRVGRSVRQFGSRHLRGLTDDLREATGGFRRFAQGLRTGESGFGGLNGMMARANRSFAFFRNILRTIKLPVLITGIGLFFQGLSALAAGAVAAASALGSLAGALVAIPAGALAAAQAIGALKLATAGVGDAIKAALDVQVQGGEQAINTMRRQEDASEQVADAERSLADVHRQVQNAQESLTEARRDARRELEDMRLAAEGAHDAEQQANLSLVQARHELAKTLRDPQASGLDIRFAEEAVDQARRDLERTRIDAKRARQDSADAQRKGVEGMPQVKSAKESLADANRSVADAERDLAKATRDQTDAMREQGSAATALQQKMAQLPPAAQKFVHFIVALKPRLDALRATAAQGLLPGVEKGLTSALGNFKVLRGIIGSTSSALGGLAAKAGKKLGSEVWGKDLARLGKLNTRIIKRFGNSAFNLADAFRHVLVAAEPFLDWLSDSTEEFTGWIRNEAAAGRESGRLADFFDRTRETMELLGPILEGVGGAFLNIAEAARPLGTEILDSLGGAAEGWRKWTDSTKGQNRLKNYFSETKPAIFEMGKLIRDAGKAFFELGRQRGVAHLLRMVRTELIPALTNVTGAFTGWASDFLKQFGKLRKEGVPTFEAFIHVLVENAGRAGWRIAKALALAFINAGIWGKLAVSAWLLHKLGGFKALAEWGAEAGARLGKKLFEKAAAWIAGTQTGASLLGWFQGTFGKGGRFSKAAGTAGGRVGRILGRGIGLGAIAGLITIAPLLREAADKVIVAPIQDAIEDVFGSKIGGALRKGAELIDPANLGPVPTALGIDLKGFVKGKWSDLFGADEAEASARHLRKTVGQEAKRTRDGFRDQFDKLPGIAERNMRGVTRQTLPRMDTLADQGGKKGQEFAGNVGGAFNRLSGTVKGALANIGGNVIEMLSKLGVPKPPKFNLKALVQSLPQLPPLPGKQMGGAVATVPGNSTGDRHILSVDGQPMARVESREGIFVGNRRMMSVVSNLNERFPRFQRGGLLREPQIMGPDGALKNVGQKAVQKVFEGAKALVDKQQARSAGGGYLSGGAGSVVERMGRILFRRGLDLEAAAGIAGNSYQESSWNPTAMEPATDNGGLFGFTAGKKSMASLRAFAARVKKPWQDVGTQVSFMLSTLSGSLKSRLNAASTVADTTALFMEEWERPGIPNLPRRIEGAMKALPILKRLWRGPAKRMQTGGLLKLAAGGMVAPSWDAGGETIAGSIAQLVHEYASRYDIDITAGYDPGGGHVSPGHNATGTATDVVPRSGNWGGKFAEGLGLLAKMGFEVGYDGSIPGTEAWPNHGRGNHAHIEWVGNGTAPDARMRLRDYLGGVQGSASAGPGAPPKENIPPVYKGAKTGNLDFGAVPKNLKGIERQIEKWQGQVPIYRKAKQHAEKHGKPATAQAIARNLVKIEDRLKALRDARFRERLAAVKKRLSKRVKRALKRFSGYEQIIEGAEQGYLSASQYAEQVVALEPQSPEISPQGKGESDKAYEERSEAAEQDYVKRFTQYVDGQEGPAFQGVLGKVADWRNKILQAEMFGFGKGKPSVSASATAWEKEIRGARNRVKQIEAFTKAVAERVSTYRSKHRKGGLPKWLREQIAERDNMRKELPFLKLRDSRLSELVLKAREMFFPGGENRLGELPEGTPVQIPLPGSGSLEEKLQDVQGIHWPEQHELLPASALAPPRVAGRFGGIVWDVQTSIEELGLKIRQATNSLGGGGGGGEGDSERDSLLEELLRQANQRLAVKEVQMIALKGWDDRRQGLLPPFGGVAHTGAIVPGPVGAERTMITKAGEGIFTPEQMAAMGGEMSNGDTTVVIESIVINPDGTATVRQNGREYEAEVRSTRGIGVMTPGGRPR